MTPQLSLDQFNQQMRGSALWQDWMRAHGINLSGPIKLSDEQRKAFQRDLAAVGVQFDKGMEIDPAGNVNQNEGFGKQVKRWGPIVGGAALAAFGIPGVMPGLLTGSSGAAAASGTAAATNAATTAAKTGFSFANALPAIIGGGGQLAGNIIAGRAAGKAAEAQERAANEALAFERQQYGDEQTRLQPYRDMGSQAYAQVAKMLGLQPGATPSAPTAPTPPGTFSFARSTAQPGLVPLTAPDGTTRMVTPEKAAQYKQRWSAQRAPTPFSPREVPAYG